MIDDKLKDTVERLEGARGGKYQTVVATNDLRLVLTALRDETGHWQHCLEPTYKAERDQARRDLDRKDHECAALKAESVEARARANWAADVNDLRAKVRDQAEELERLRAALEVEEAHNSQIGSLVSQRDAAEAALAAELAKVERLDGILTRIRGRMEECFSTNDANRIVREEMEALNPAPDHDRLLKNALMDRDAHPERYYRLNPAPEPMTDQERIDAKRAEIKARRSTPEPTPNGWPGSRHPAPTAQHAFVRSVAGPWCGRVADDGKSSCGISEQAHHTPSVAGQTATLPVGVPAAGSEQPDHEFVLGRIFGRTGERCIHVLGTNWCGLPASAHQRKS